MVAVIEWGDEYLFFVDQIAGLLPILFAFSWPSHVKRHIYYVFSVPNNLTAVLVINNQGLPRVCKYYDPNLSVEVKQQLIRETFQLVSRRSEHVCNFLEGKTGWGKDTKIVYRHYATLYFIFIVDSSESELGILDLMQVFVESLDKCFENVCELDLVFRSEQVHFILDEIISAGLVLETNLGEVLSSVESQRKLEHRDPISAGLSVHRK